MYYVAFGVIIIDAFFIVAGIVGGLAVVGFVAVVVVVVVVDVDVGIGFDECRYFAGGIVGHVGYFEALLFVGLWMSILFVGDSLKVFVKSC